MEHNILEQNTIYALKESRKSNIKLGISILSACLVNLIAIIILWKDNNLQELVTSLTDNIHFLSFPNSFAASITVTIIATFLALSCVYLCPAINCFIHAREDRINIEKIRTQGLR